MKNSLKMPEKFEKEVEHRNIKANILIELNRPIQFTDIREHYIWIKTDLKGYGFASFPDRVKSIEPIEEFLKVISKKEDVFKKAVDHFLQYNPAEIMNKLTEIGFKPTDI